MYLCVCVCVCVSLCVCVTAHCWIAAQRRQRKKKGFVHVILAFVVDVSCPNMDDYMLQTAFVYVCVLFFYDY